MADVQLEYGYTRIANELLDALIAASLRGRELAVCLFVIRESYGWNRKTTEPMGYKLMAKKMGGVPRSSVKLAINVLVQAKVLKRCPDGSWEVEKNHEIWTIKCDKGDSPLPPSPRAGGQPATPQASENGAGRGQPATPLSDEKGDSPLPPGGQPATPRGAARYPLGGQPATPSLYEESKDRERKVKTARARRAPCQPPTLEEVKAYCRERNRGVNAAKWHNHYSANGWMVGKVPMVDWKAAVRTWEDPEAEGQARAAERVRCKRCRLDGNWAKALAKDGKTPLCEACKTQEIVEDEMAAEAAR